jgi:GDP-L-fucose synthase
MTVGNEGGDAAARSTDTVLITGSSGLVGHALIDELTAAGYCTLVPVPGANTDLRDWPSTLELVREVRPSLVFHLAARVYGIMGNRDNQSAAFIDNLRMNTNVIEAARLAGVRKVVAMGSAAIYSDDCPIPMSEDDVWLGPPHASEAPYAHAKRAMLAQLETYHANDGLEYAYCVSTNLYGPHDRFDEQWGHVLPSLISKFYRAKHTGSDVVAWGTGTPTRDFLYSRDAASALRLIAERGHGVINLASGTTQTVREAVDLLAKITGCEDRVVWDSTKPDGQHQRAYNVDRLREIGFAPGHDLEAGLRATFDWFEAHVETARR